MTYTGFWASLILATTYEGEIWSFMSLIIAVGFLISTICLVGKEEKHDK